MKNYKIPDLPAHFNLAIGTFYFISLRTILCKIDTCMILATPLYKGPLDIRETRILNFIKHFTNQLIQF